MVRDQVRIEGRAGRETRARVTQGLEGHLNQAETTFLECCSLGLALSVAGSTHLRDRRTAGQRVLAHGNQP